MLTESVPVTPAVSAPMPASSHILNRDFPRFVENTAWPDAQPELVDLPHSKDCADCLAAQDDRMPDIDCRGCGYIGEAIIAHRTYSIVTAHCPMCGELTSDAVERDRDAA